MLVTILVLWNRIGYAARRALNIPVYFYCRRTRVCPCSDYTHEGIHYSCRHCTFTPFVVCGKCGRRYLDRAAPGPQWTFSLWSGWCHAACRKERANDLR